MDGKSKDCPSETEQNSLNEDNSVGMESKIPAVDRRYSAPSGFCAKNNIQPENSSEKAEEKKKSSPEKETPNEGESLVCDKCNVSFTESLQYNLHMTSKSHRKTLTAKKLRSLLSFFEKAHVPDQNFAAVSRPHSCCLLCQKSFDKPEDYFQHSEKKSHKKRVCLQKIFNKINAELTDSEDDAVSGSCSSQTAVGINSRRRCSSTSSFTTIGDDCFMCRYCDKTFRGSVPFGQHLASKSHEKRKRRSSLLARLSELLSEELEEDNSPPDEENPDRSSFSE